MPSSFENLKRIVIANSKSKNFLNAVLEWKLVDTEEDELNESQCICGKENIRYLHKIQNENNGNILFPIGSSCIKKFDRSDLNELISVKEKLFKLYHAVNNKEFLELSPTLFSRKLIKYLYKNGAFESKDSRFPAEENYDFFLEMFNKKNKNDITAAQHRKIKAILLNNIKKYVEEQLKNKILTKKEHQS